jgi:hypothetical protein
MTKRRPVPERAREAGARLSDAFRADQRLAERLNDAQRRLQRANDELWWGLHPDGLATVYQEEPAVVDQAFANNRSEVLGAPDPLAAIQRVHWQVHRTFHDYQAASEERRQLAADVGELSRELVHALTAAGWTEDQARNANVDDLVCSEDVR